MNKVIYDSDCKLCEKIKTVLHKLDVFSLFHFIESTKYRDKINLFDKEILTYSIVLITSNGKILTEFRACRYIISRIPVFFPFLLILYFPFISIYFGNLLYKFVSINRKCINE